MSLTLLVSYCVCKNGRKPPSALTGDISSQILVLFIEGQICIANLWRDDQQDSFFFPKVLLQVFLLAKQFHSPGLSPGANCGSACVQLQLQHHPGRGRVPCSSPSRPSPVAAPGRGRQAPSTSCPSCLPCHVLLRAWRSCAPQVVAPDRVPAARMCSCIC